MFDAPDADQPGVVADVETSSQQGAYLAGILAAETTKTGTLGIVISAADTNWYKMAGGFVAGARSVNPDVKIRFAQIGQAAYADAAGGKRVTTQVIAAGADVVFGMGDGSSFGMLQAVETAKPPAGADKVWFIDVIGDKTNVDKKGVLLSSVVWDFTDIYNQAIADIGGRHLRPEGLRPERRQRHLAAADRQGSRRGVGRRGRGPGGRRRRQHRDPADAGQGGAGPADRLATRTRTATTARPRSWRPGRRHDDRTDEPSRTRPQRRQVPPDGIAVELSGITKSYPGRPARTTASTS